MNEGTVCTEVKRLVSDGWERRKEFFFVITCPVLDVEIFPPSPPYSVSTDLSCSLRRLWVEPFNLPPRTAMEKRGRHVSVSFEVAASTAQCESILTVSRAEAREYRHSRQKMSHRPGRRGQTMGGRTVSVKRISVRETTNVALCSCTEHFGRRRVETGKAP